MGIPGLKCLQWAYVVPKRTLHFVVRNPNIHAEGAGLGEPHKPPPRFIGSRRMSHNQNGYVKSGHFPCFKFLLSLLIKNFSLRKNYPTQIDFLLSSTLLQTLPPSQGLYNTVADSTNLKYLLWWYVLDSERDWGPTRLKYLLWWDVLVSERQGVRSLSVSSFIEKEPHKQLRMK